MMKKTLIFLGLLSLAMITVSGCAQKMAKQDDASPPSSAQAAPSESKNSSQTQAAAPTEAAVAASAPAPTPAETSKAPESPNAAELPAPLPETAKAADAAKPVETAEVKQVAAALLPLPPQEIMNTIKKLTTHPRVRYLSRTAQYSYYVGGLVDAEYDLNKNQLVVTNDDTSGVGAVKCLYSNEGMMIADSKSIPPQVIGECNKLINELTTSLSQ